MIQLHTDSPSISSPDDLSFLALPAKRSASQVSGAAESAFLAVEILLGQMISPASDCTTKLEFASMRRSVIESYFKVMLALGGLISAAVPRVTIERLSFEALTEMEAEFLQYGREILGEDLRDQAIFTVFTLRKISLAGQKLTARLNELPLHHHRADSDAARQFMSHVLYARFHLDCMLRAMKLRRPLYPEVVAEISDGLLSLVNAHAYLQQGLVYRTAEVSEEMIDLEFDDEDLALMHASTREALL